MRLFRGGLVGHLAVPQKHILDPSVIKWLCVLCFCYSRTFVGGPSCQRFFPYPKLAKCEIYLCWKTNPRIPASRFRKLTNA